MSYPLLSDGQQLALPELISSTPVKALFEDSTHQLWRCQTKDGERMLKICNQKNVAITPFWRGAEYLFDYNFPLDLRHIGKIYQSITALSSLKIPSYITSASVDRGSYQEGYVFAEFLEGDGVNETNVTPQFVNDLAEHLSRLHSDTQSHWGSFHAAAFTADEWPYRLKDTITKLVKHPHNQTLISNVFVNDILEQAPNSLPQQFVPIMLDLRWDQFLTQEGKLSALIDLDAFVFGPKELELVLLEYLLTESECQIFKQHYELRHSFPELNEVRDVYRLLLFLMNVLGEENIHSWMEMPPWFDFY